MQEVFNPCGDHVWVYSHVFQFVNEFVVINFIERFTEVHDNDISLLTLILTVYTISGKEPHILNITHPYEIINY